MKTLSVFFACYFLENGQIRRTLEVFIMENIIFGLMVVIVAGAGLLTCIYEAGGSVHKTADELSNLENTEQNRKKDK